MPSPTRLAPRLLSFLTPLLVLLLGCDAVDSRPHGPQPPSIVLLVADDLRPDAVGALGNDDLRTPVLDRLAGEGVAFTGAMAPNPLCTPSRAELLTGTEGLRNGVMFFGEAMDPALPLLPERLREAGYATWYVGKWHNDGSPGQRGYDAARRVAGGMQSHFMAMTDGLDAAVGYSSTIFAEAAVDYVREATDQPFFLHVNFTAPHDPREVPPGYEDAYDPAALSLPANFLPRHPFDNGYLQERDENLLPRPRDPAQVRTEIAAYYAMVSQLDEQIGRILDALEETGRAGNTIVVFLGDHGLALGSHGLLGKHSLYEHSIGTPLLLRGPGVPAGQRVAAAVYLRDLYPTLLDLAGLTVPAFDDTQSLVPLWETPDASGRDYVFGYYRDGIRMVKNARWKLIHYRIDGTEQLFDLQADPNELDDLVAAHPDTAAALRRVLQDWQRRVGDTAALVLPGGER